MEWNRETILHFISLIKQRPAIWDVQSPDYRIKRRRHEAVDEVGLLMGVSPMEVNTKWTILRNQYSREKRKITESKGEAKLYVTKWYAYKEMDALMARSKRPINNFWMQDRHSDEEDSSDSPPPTPSRPSASATQQDHNDCIAPVTFLCNQTLKTLKSISETNHGSTSDDLTNFGSYIAAHLRKYTPTLQSRAKYEINKILYALDMESMGEYTTTIHTIEDNDDGLIIAKECKIDPLQKD